MIRRAELKDLEGVSKLFNLYRVFYKQDEDIASAKAFIGERLKNEDSVILVYEENDVFLGFVQLYPSFSSVSMQRLWVLNDLFVSGGARGRGVAKTLLEYSKNFARESGAKGLTLKTARDNKPAQKLYESCHWKKEEDFISYNKIF